MGLDAKCLQGINSCYVQITQDFVGILKRQWKIPSAGTGSVLYILRLVWLEIAPAPVPSSVKGPHVMWYGVFTNNAHKERNGPGYLGRPTATGINVPPHYRLFSLLQQKDT